MSLDTPPRWSRRRAALAVIVVLALAGGAVGALWSVLAPPARGVIALTRGGDRIHAYLGAEADNLFTAAFILWGMLTVLAVVAAVWVWQWRAHRGPVLVAALATGCAVAAGVAGAVGTVLVRLRYGTIDIDAAPVSPERRVHYVTEAPAAFFGSSPLQIAVSVLFPAAIAAMVYALTAVSTSRDDLGAWPPMDSAAAIGRIETTGDAQPVAPS